MGSQDNRRFIRLIRFTRVHKVNIRPIRRLLHLNVNHHVFRVFVSGFQVRLSLFIYFCGGRWIHPVPGRARLSLLGGCFWWFALSGSKSRGVVQRRRGRRKRVVLRHRTRLLRNLFRFRFSTPRNSTMLFNSLLMTRLLRTTNSRRFTYRFKRTIRQLPRSHNRLHQRGLLEVRHLRQPCINHRRPPPGLMRLLLSLNVRTLNTRPIRTFITSSGRSVNLRINVNKGPTTILPRKRRTIQSRVLNRHHTPRMTTHSHFRTHTPHDRRTTRFNHHRHGKLTSLCSRNNLLRIRSQFCSAVVSSAGVYTFYPTTPYRTKVKSAMQTAAHE